MIATAGPTAWFSFANVRVFDSHATLSPPLRVRMERSFGESFADVRVHEGPGTTEGGVALAHGRDLHFAPGYYRPGTAGGDALIGHELTHVVQQRRGQLTGGGGVHANSPDHWLEQEARHQGALAARGDRVSVGGRAAYGSRQRDGTLPAQPKRLEVELVGSDAKLDEPLAVMADRWARDHGGIVLRVSSLENMISQLVGLVKTATCIGRLVVWYHGSPEMQLVVGEYQLPPKNLRLPASGFTREWLQLDKNRPLLNIFRHLFCCDAMMQWIGCGTAMVRASGGLRSPRELEREPALLQEHPDVYQSAQEARQHGATLPGASFGQMNVQAWANATCATIRSATNLVTLRPGSRNPISIDNGGTWIDVAPQTQCPCDPGTGRVGGEAPTRAEMVKAWQKETAALVGPKNVRWHQLVGALRTGLPHATEVVGAGTVGERTFQVQPGSLPAALQEEMKHRVGGRRGPLERYYATQVLFPLLQIAGAGLTPPAPLPNVPMPDHLFVRIAAGGTWAAVTQRHLAVVNRNDFWHWTVYNDRAIGDTPEFTRTVIQHELEHAADYEKDLREFEASHTRPAGDPPAAFGLPAEESVVRGFTGAWGKYINDFIDFQEKRTPPERHLEIILGQRRQTAPGGAPSWNRWSAAERAYWFELVFHHLPPDIKGGSPLAGEDDILDAFKTAGPDLQLAAVARAYDTIHYALCPGQNAKSAEVAQARASARTLVQHFDPIIERVLREQMRDTPRGTVLDLLKRPPEHPHGMECQL